VLEAASSPKGQQQSGSQSSYRCTTKHAGLIPVWKQMNSIRWFCSFIAIVLLLFLPPAAIGQITDSSSPSPSFLHIGISGLHYQVNDQLVAPIRWDGMGFGLRLSYVASSPALDHEIELLLPASFLSDRYDHNGYAFEVSLGYSRLYLIHSSVLGGNLSMGGQVRWNAHCQFYADWDDSHLYWLNAYDVSAALRWSKEYESQQRLSITMHVPLLAFVSRPPEYQYIDQAPLQRPSYYFDTLHRDLRMTSVNEYVSLDLRADYARQVGESTILGATWSFQYKTCRFPQAVSIISNTLTFNYVIIL
jgi:hypothetical protein